MRIAGTISLTPSERATLHAWRQKRGAGARLAQRAQIILLAAEGRQNKDIAAELGTDPQTVGRWRARFATQRLTGIKDELPRSGRKRRARKRFELEILRRLRLAATRQTALSIRALARALGVNHMLVYRVWKDHEAADKQS